MARESFGVDAPVVPVGLGAARLLCLGAAVVLRRARRGWPAATAAGYAALLGSGAAIYLHASMRGEHAVWREVLDGVGLDGGEVIVDLGCGRGAVLVAAARRVPGGRVVGVDLWRCGDRSGNSPDAAWANARAGGVSDRVALHTADMTAVPLPDASADVLLSSLAIYNIPDPAGREAAVREAVRLLRPGGRLAVVDIRRVRDYARMLVGAGMRDIGQRRLGWRMWYGGPWGAAHLVTAAKPAR